MYLGQRKGSEKGGRVVEMEGIVSGRAEGEQSQPSKEREGWREPVDQWAGQKLGQGERIARPEMGLWWVGTAIGGDEFRLPKDRGTLG